jgi:transporter family-2 protein
MQGALNSALRAKVGLGTSVVINSIVVLFGSLLVAMALGEQLFQQRPQAPWHLLLGGGLCGLLIISVGVTVFPRLGAATTISLVVGGQLFTAMVLDHFGLLGVQRQPVDPLRIAGLVLVFLGVMLVQGFGSTRTSGSDLDSALPSRTAVLRDQQS